MQWVSALMVVVASVLPSILNHFLNDVIYSDPQVSFKSLVTIHHVTHQRPENIRWSQVVTDCTVKREINHKFAIIGLDYGNPEAFNCQTSFIQLCQHNSRFDKDDLVCGFWDLSSKRDSLRFQTWTLLLYHFVLRCNQALDDNIYEGLWWGSFTTMHGQNLRNALVYFPNF